MSSPLFPRNPENSNFQQPTKFQLAFPQTDDMVFFCQEVDIPGVSMGEAVHVTPNLDLYVPGTKIVYDPLTVSFLINEGISSWLGLYNWMKGITTDMNPKWQKRQDAILTIFSNKNNPIIRFEFKNIFPQTVSRISMSTKESAEEVLTCSATFRYDYFIVTTL